MPEHKPDKHLRVIPFTTFERLALMSKHDILEWLRMSGYIEKPRGRRAIGKINKSNVPVLVRYVKDSSDLPDWQQEMV